MKEDNEKVITNDDDFVMIERGGEILSGGFHVNSILLKNKHSPMHTLNQKIYGGERAESNNVSDIFKDLAIPAGIFYQPNKFGGYREDKNKVIEENEEINEDIYEKLVKLATIEETKKINKKKNTKKQYVNKEKNIRKTKKTFQK
jgi:hypothetical protein